MARTTSPATSLVALLAILFVTSGCGQRASAPARHPTPTSIAEFAVTNHIDRDSTASGGLAAVADRLRGARLVMEIAPDDSSSQALIGGVAALRGLSNGSLLHLDDRFNVVRIYDAQGILEQEVGREGLGPGEFVSPVDLAVTDSAVYVLDQIARLVSFRRTAGGLEPGNTTALTLESSRICVTNGRMFVIGTATNALSAGELFQAHEIDPSTADLIASFGPGYKYGNPVIKLELSRAVGECSPETQTIATASVNYPLVRGYDLEGHLKWASWIDAIEPNYLLGTVVDGNVAAQPVEEAFSDQIVDIVAVPGGYFLLQAFRGFPRGKPRPPDVGMHTYLLDAKSGEGVSLGKRLPRINFVSNEYFLATRYDAAPSIARYDY